MREIFIDIRQKKVNNIDMQILSMGMTNDYEIAVEEGATIVRVGTGLFGHRQKNEKYREGVVRDEQICRQNCLGPGLQQRI